MWYMLLAAAAVPTPPFLQLRNQTRLYLKVFPLVHFATSRKHAPLLAVHTTCFPAQRFLYVISTVRPVVYAAMAPGDRCLLWWQPGINGGMDCSSYSWLSSQLCVCVNQSTH